MDYYNLRIINDKHFVEYLMKKLLAFIFAIFLSLSLLTASLTNYVFLWTTNLDGSNLKTTQLGGTSPAASCVVSGNYLYIIGRDIISSTESLLRAVSQFSLLKPQ